MGREEAILRQWLDVCETEGGILVAQQLLHKRPLLVAQMVEEWLNHYRRLSYAFIQNFYNNLFISVFFLKANDVGPIRSSDSPSRLFK